MKNRMEMRRKELESERERGLQMLSTMESEQAKLQVTLQRITGAIAMLEELLGTFVEDEMRVLNTTAATETEGVDNGDNS